MAYWEGSSEYAIFYVSKQAEPPLRKLIKKSRIENWVWREKIK